MKDQEIVLISTMLGRQWLMRFDHLHNERQFMDRQSERGPWERPEQFSRRLQVRETVVYHCWLPVVDGNWTEQVPSIISSSEEDRRGDAWLWGCSTFGTSWLTTHPQIHFPACQSVNEAQCHCSTSVTYSDPYPVSELVDWLSCWSNPYYRHCKYEVEWVVKRFTQVIAQLL